MDQNKLEELRQYYDHTDTSEEIKDAELDDEVVQSPMVGITVRLPAELLERVRQMAAEQGIKTTALIRRWIEDSTERNENWPCSAPLLAARGLGAWQQTVTIVPRQGDDDPLHALHLMNFNVALAERHPVA